MNVPDKVHKNTVSLWLKDLFREKFGEKSKKEIEENETIGEEKCDISINKNCEGISQKSVMDNQKMVGISIKNRGGY